MDVRELPVEEIVLDQRLNLRDRLDPETVERYGEVWDRLPPVSVFEVRKRWLLADGFHRHAAAVQLKRPHIPAVITAGSFEEALDFAVCANLNHGLPLTRAERRRAVETKLRLHPDWSDRQIAKELTVGRELISRIRGQLVEAGQIPAVEGRVGADGKVYPSLPSDPNERRPRDRQAAGGDPGRAPARGRGGEAPWDDTVDPLPPIEGESYAPEFGGAPVGLATVTRTAPDLARSGPVAVAAPTIDEMLELMRHQAMELVAWIQADGFIESYPKAGRHARGLFLASIKSLNEWVEALRAVA